MNVRMDCPCFVPTFHWVVLSSAREDVVMTILLIVVVLLLMLLSVQIARWGALMVVILSNIEKIVYSQLLHDHGEKIIAENKEKIGSSRTN